MLHLRCRDQGLVAVPVAVARSSVALVPACEQLESWGVAELEVGIPVNSARGVALALATQTEEPHNIKLRTAQDGPFSEVNDDASLPCVDALDTWAAAMFLGVEGGARAAVLKKLNSARSYSAGEFASKFGVPDAPQHLAHLVGEGREETEEFMRTWLGVGDVPQERPKKKKQRITTLMDAGLCFQPTAAEVLLPGMPGISPEVLGQLTAQPGLFPAVVRARATAQAAVRRRPWYSRMASALSSCARGNKTGERDALQLLAARIPLELDLIEQACQVPDETMRIQALEGVAGLLVLQVAAFRDACSRAGVRWAHLEPLLKECNICAEEKRDVQTFAEGCSRCSNRARGAWWGTLDLMYTTPAWFRDDDVRIEDSDDSLSYVLEKLESKRMQPNRTSAKCVTTCLSCLTAVDKRVLVALANRSIKL